MLGNGMDLASIAKAYILINDFSEQYLVQALAQLENSASQPENLPLLSLLLSKYAEENPQASMAFIEDHLTSAQSKAAATMSVIATWSKKDALAAYDWFVSQKNNQGKGVNLTNSTMALHSIFSGLAKQDFHSAIDKLIDILEDSENNFFAVSGITNVLTTKSEFAELMDRTSELEDRRLKDSVINYWVTRDPQEAIEWIDSVDDSEERTKLQEGVLSSWIRTEPMEAANWYLGNAEPKEKQSYADKIVEKLNYGNPETALNWLSQQTDIDQDKSTTKLLKSSAYRHTNFAINNLNLLKNDKDKLDVSIRIHMTLERNNKKKANEFVAQSTIKDALQKRIEEYRKYSSD